MKKYLFIFLGSISLFLGFLGLFTPGIPTTPFVLLTGYLYAKSSPKLYAKLENNRIAGMYLRRMKGGLGWKMQLASISLMWTMVSITAFLVFESGSTMRYVMIGLGVIGTISQLIAFRKRKPKTQHDTELITDLSEITDDNEYNNSSIILVDNVIEEKATV